MTTYTALCLLSMIWAAQLWVKLALALCVLLGAGVQYVALHRQSRFGRWVFPLVLAALWLILELAGQQVVNYAQLFVLYGLLVVLACLLGAALGTAWRFLAAQRRRKRPAKEK